MIIKLSKNVITDRFIRTKTQAERKYNVIDFHSEKLKDDISLVGNSQADFTVISKLNFC